MLESHLNRDVVVHVAHCLASLATSTLRLNHPYVTQMAKLRKLPKSHPESPRSSKSDVRTTDWTGPAVLPVITEQSAFATQRLRNAPNQERRQADSPIRGVFQGRERVDASRADWTKANSPNSQPVKMEPRTVTSTQRRPSPLRISQEVLAESEIVVAGPSQPQSEYRREKCGPSCQKCGRPRKPDTSIDKIIPAPHASWPLPGPGDETVPGPSENAIEKATPVPSNDQPSKRRKYFSLPTKSKPSFKGPTELVSVKAKAVEPTNNTGPSEERPRPVSEPSPTKSSFKGPVGVECPKPQPKPAAHVHFATDEHLGRFAGIIRAPETTTSGRLQALRSLTPGPASNARSQHHGNAVSKPPTSRPQRVPQSHPPSLTAAQPTVRANSAILYEWPLVTTLVNRPTSNPSIRHPTLASATSRSSLSISRRPSRRNSRPYNNQHIHAPTPIQRTSSRHKTLVQQSRKVSYIMEHASDSSPDSMSIQILDMLQGFPGGELAATAKTLPDTERLSERPSLLRLQTYPPDARIDTFKLNTDAPAEERKSGLYSPSEYGSEDEDDDDDQPVTPPQSDFSLASYSIGDDKKTNLRPDSTLTQRSFLIGDDKKFPLKKASDFELAPASAPPSGPSSTSDESEPVTAESPPSAPSTSLPLSAQPLTLTLTPSPSPVPDSEGMIPVDARLSVVDLPEAVSSAPGSVNEVDEEDIDPDWCSWGALPGSYGSAGMWSGAPSPGLEYGYGGGPAELGVASNIAPRN
jgi:hypothetical protein